jgi:hypothetical protein
LTNAPQLVARKHRDDLHLSPPQCPYSRWVPNLFSHLNSGKYRILDFDPFQGLLVVP